MELDIHAIIGQLVKVFHVSEDRELYEKSFRYLTPITKVSKGPAQYDPSIPILVVMDPLKESDFTFSDMVRSIDSKELYPFYRKLPKKEFRNRLNKTLYDYVSKQLEQDREENVPDSENIWIQPNAAFVNWFHKKYLIHKDIVPFNQSNKDEEYYSKGGCTKAQLAYIKLYNLTNEYIDQNPKTADGKEMSINKAVIIVYSDNKHKFPNWADSSLNKLYHEGQNLTINI